MLNTAIATLLYLLLPLLAIQLARRYRVIDWMSPVLLAYGFGILWGNLPFVQVDSGLAGAFTEISVPLAIPLLLFGTDFVRWVRNAGKAAVAYGLAVVSVLIMALIAGLIFAPASDESWKAAGMLVGVYTGGTPNLLSIGLAVGISEESYILLNAADVVLSGVYLLVLLTIAKPVLSRFMPAYQGAVKFEGEIEEIKEIGTSWKGMTLAFLLSVLIVAASAGIALLLTGGLAIAIVILAITTLAILASFVPRVRALEGSETLGNYFILLFAVAIGTLTDFGALIHSGSTLFLFTTLTLYGAILLHYILCTIFRIDADTAIITSTAAVFGPAFIPPIAEALDNKDMLLTGLTTGLVGYAVGNYLGLGLAYLVRGLTG
jgi:uncharacterized membrane protein